MQEGKSSVLEQRIHIFGRAHRNQLDNVCNTSCQVDILNSRLDDLGDQGEGCDLGDRAPSRVIFSVCRNRNAAQSKGDPVLKFRFSDCFAQESKGLFYATVVRKGSLNTDLADERAAELSHVFESCHFDNRNDVVQPSNFNDLIPVGSGSICNVAQACDRFFDNFNVGRPQQFDEERNHAQSGQQCALL
jgi:hypothetical protein